MAKRFIDGMEVIVPDETVGVARDIEDAVYQDGSGEPENILECDTTEEYQVAMEAFNGAQVLDLLKHTEGYVEAQRILDLEASDACRAQTTYMGIDSKKKEFLDLRRQVAVFAANRLRDLVENAALVPRPILIGQ